MVLDVRFLRAQNNITSTRVFIVVIIVVVAAEVRVAPFQCFHLAHLDIEFGKPRRHQLHLNRI